MKDAEEIELQPLNAKKTEEQLLVSSGGLRQTSIGVPMRLLPRLPQWFFFGFFFLASFFVLYIAIMQGKVTGEHVPNAILKPPGEHVPDAILKPPFRIFQIGKPRSGTTFQTTLLYALASLKSHQAAKEYYISKLDLEEERIQNLIQTQQGSLVMKTHREKEFVEKLQADGAVAVFTSSSEMVPYAMYHQEFGNLIECSLCEVDNYRKFFGLTDNEVAMLKDYMSYYEVLRQCCGWQMSKYEVKSLNGCNMTEYFDLPEYPHCERHNLTDVEIQFDAIPIPYGVSVGGKAFLWNKIGDCTSIRDSVSNGFGFNKRKFMGC